MISAYNLKKQYGSRILFEDETFSIAAGEKVGLVGRNGEGKTTLFRLIIGQEQCDAGEIVIPKNYKLGYLDQNVVCKEPTVLEEACLGLSKKEKDDHWKVKKILSGLGFSENDFLRAPSEFSSGYNMRIALAKLLVSKPDLLLLDEPTNFLDIVSIRWFRDFLRSWKSEIMLISHDRTFMDNIITHTMGIHRKYFRKMKGTTAHYYTQVKKEEEIYDRKRVNDEKIRKKEQEFIDKFRVKARRASQAQSRLKKLEKMDFAAKLENIETLSFSFNYFPFPAKYLMEAKDVTFSYDGNEPYLIDSFDLHIAKNDKICIIGQNGAGKTTLLNLLTQELKPVKGNIRKHSQLQQTHFEHGKTVDLNEENTIEKEITSCFVTENKSMSRSICGAMMFSGDTALKKISVLSGGERCRVMLGKILASPSNLLMLDEPTHHLDIESCRAIIDAVKRFEGSAVIVSHDEYFLRKVATKLIIFQFGKILVFPGTYDEFLDRIGWEQEGAVKEQEKDVNPKNKKELRRIKAEELAEKNKILKPLKQKIEQLEKNISDLEKEHVKVTQDLIVASEDQDSKKIIDLGQVLVGLDKKIEKSYEDLIEVNIKYDEAVEK